MSTQATGPAQPPGQLPPLLSQFPLGRALPYIQVRKGVPLPGEVLTTETWQPELGVINTKEVSFRIIFLTRYQEVPPQGMARSRVVVCIPASPSYQLREPQAGYQMMPAQLPPVTQQAVREEAAAYSAGRIVTRESLALSPVSVFSSTRPSDWVEKIAAALFPATWEATLPYASLLAPQIQSAGQPPEAQASLLARLRDWQTRLSRLASALDEIAAALGPPADNRFKEAIDRLARVCRPSDMEGFYLEAEFIYGSPPAMASGLALIEKLEALAPSLPEVIFARNYLMGAALSDRDRELDMDRQSLLEQINTDNLLSNPHLWPSLKTLFDWFKARYCSAYLAHFRQWQPQMKQLRQYLLDKERGSQALRYLNSIAELGAPVGIEVLETYPRLCDRVKPCPIENGLEQKLEAAPLCPYCGLKLPDEAPVAEVNEFVYGLEQALVQQQRRLSSRAVHIILSHSQEPYIQRFLQIIQASNLSSLPLVLDDKLVAFIRQLLREAKQ